VGRPCSNRTNGTWWNRIGRIVVWPSIGSALDQEVEFFIGVIAFPISAIVCKHITDIWNPDAIKRIPNTASKDAMFSSRSIDPQQCAISLITLVADVAR
jgi:hypothetical protein